MNATLVSSTCLALLLAVEPAAAATITGTVSWAGRRPRTPVSVTHDQHVCGVENPLLAVGPESDRRGRLRDAVVFVEAPGRSRRPRRTVVFDQVGCIFVPRIAAATTGDRVRFRNSDAVLHTVHARRSGGETVANIAMPMRGQEVPGFTAGRSGVIELRCDAGHRWMSAHLMVLSHARWSVTGADGGYTVTGAPSGRVKLVAWHPDLGRVEHNVEVPSRTAVVRLDVRF